MSELLKESVHTPAANKARVDALLAQMEVAYEEDIKAVKANLPALHKLRMLPRVQETLAVKTLHSDLLDNGLLNVMKAWIDPAPLHGTLPNSKIRSTVLQLLCELKVDCTLEDRRQQLKRSGLGTLVMFYEKLKDELPANRKLARQLVSAWSRPVLAPVLGRSREEEEKEKERILQARQKREQVQRDDLKRKREQDERTLPGQPGFRDRAHIPAAAALDYVKVPQSKVEFTGKKKKSKEHRLIKKLKSIGKSSPTRHVTVGVTVRDVNVNV